MKIGFVDHHLNNYHADVFLRLLREDLKDEGVEIAAAWESTPAGDDWCKKNGVDRAGSIAELMERVDAAVVLAPDNIDTHLEFCREVLPFGKPTAIDKMLEHSVADAEKVVELSEAYDAPIMSASGLAYSVELEDALSRIERPIEVFSEGMGQWLHYGIHTLSPVLRILGSGARRVIETGSGPSRVVSIDFASGSRAHVTVRHAQDNYGLFPWRLGVRMGEESYLACEIKDFDGFYRNLVSAMVKFFRTRQADFAVDQSLAAVAIIEASDVSLQAGGQWVDL